MVPNTFIYNLLLSINGEKIKYIRRKRASPCAYPRSETIEELDTYSFLQSCPCTPEDYEW